MARVNRQTVDLSGHPDLVVIYLGTRVTAPRGLARLLALGPQINKAAAARPEPPAPLLEEALYPPESAAAPRSRA